MKSIDVTDKVKFGNPDDELLPILQCVCGHKFHLWEHNISIYKDLIFEKCPKCGAKLYFRNSIRVYQLVDNE